VEEGELKQSISTNENKGFLKIASRRGTPGARAAQLPNNKATQNDLLATAQRSIGDGTRAVEKLINSIPLDDHFALGVLGPILVGLRDAEKELQSLKSN
jgi:hypothetical protein